MNSTAQASVPVAAVRSAVLRRSASARTAPRSAAAWDSMRVAVASSSPSCSSGTVLRSSRRSESTEAVAASVTRACAVIELMFE